MNKPIKFIYFDVGGVAILDFSKTDKWQEMKEDLGIDESIDEDFDILFRQYSPLFCSGKKKIEDFIDEVKRKLKLNVLDNYSMLDDFVNRFEKNETIEPLIQEISKDYKVGLLTEMYPGMFIKIEARELFPNVAWNVVVDSSEVGYTKSEVGLFRIAEEMAGVKSENILFIENKPKNLVIPKKRGWKTFLYDPADLITSNRELKQFIKE